MERPARHAAQCWFLPKRLKYCLCYDNTEFTLFFFSGTPALLYLTLKHAEAVLNAAPGHTAASTARVWHGRHRYQWCVRRDHAD